MKRIDSHSFPMDLNACLVDSPSIAQEYSAGRRAGRQGKLTAKPTQHVCTVSWVVVVGGDQHPGGLQVSYPGELAGPLGWPESEKVGIMDENDEHETQTLRTGPIPLTNRPHI